MRKMRIYEYAKENNTTSKAVIKKLTDMGIEVTNHMSVIQGDVLEKLEQGAKQGKPKGEESKKQEPQNKQGSPKNSPNNEQKGNQTKGKKPTRPSGEESPTKEKAVKKQSKEDDDKKRNKNKDKKKSKQSGKRQQEVNHKGAEKQQPMNETPKKVTYTLPITVGAFAEKINKEPSEIIKKTYVSWCNGNN